MITIWVTTETELRTVLHALRHEWTEDWTHGKPADLTIDLRFGERLAADAGAQGPSNPEDAAAASA